jgi:hypothetical protein
MKHDILTDKEIKSNVPKWVIAFCATLMFLSVFINSIGLNLMQINGALTAHIIKLINNDDPSDELKEQLKQIKLDIIELKKDSHKSKP